MAGKKLIGLINLMESDYQMKQLSAKRPLASIPFGGRYRVIDFVLSNMSAAGIDTIGIYLQDKERSLFDHIRSGRPWNMDRMTGGIFYYSPHSTPDQSFDIKGDIMNFYNNMDIFDKSNAEYVILSGSKMVLNIDYLKVLEEHEKSGADVTCIFKHFDSSDHYYDDSYVLNTDDDGRVKSFGVKIVKNSSQNVPDYSKVSMDMFLMKVSVLRGMIEDAVSDGSFNYMTEVIHEGAKNLNYRGYEFKGFIGYISNIRNYYESNMDLLDEEKLMDLFYGSSSINTKIRNESPSYYSEDSNVTHSLIANGCEIEGEVINSILFRRVKVEKGARIENSIIMQNCTIESGTTLKCVIADKNCTISKGQILAGTPKNPLVIAKDTKL